MQEQECDSVTGGPHRPGQSGRGDNDSIMYVDYSLRYGQAGGAGVDRHLPGWRPATPATAQLPPSYRPVTPATAQLPQLPPSYRPATPATAQLPPSYPSYRPVTAQLLPWQGGAKCRDEEGSPLNRAIDQNRQPAVAR